MKNPVLKSLFVVGAILLLGAPPAGSGGLSTPFMDVRVEHVPLGQPFVVTHSSADGILLQNVGAEAIQIEVSAFIPAATDLRGGALPIPNPEWVQIAPNHAVLPPHGRIICRITLKIPNEKSYRDKEYQVMIWSRGQLPKSQGMGLNAGLISRLRFKTNS